MIETEMRTGTPMSATSASSVSKSSSIINQDAQAFQNLAGCYLQFAVEAGLRYICAGGSCARLEDRLERLAKLKNLSAEVFATSTGLFVCVKTSRSLLPIMSFARIRTSGVKLTELQLIESYFDSLSREIIDLQTATFLLSDEKQRKTGYSTGLLYCAAFVLGWSASYLGLRNGTAGATCGLVTVLTFAMYELLARRWRMSGIFCDFFGCLFALAAGSLLSLFVEASPEQLALGAFVLLVPGLTLTTAISEIAEHDFISGTSKLMRGLLTLLAMGTAEVLFKQIQGAIFPAALKARTDYPSLSLGDSFWRGLCTYGLLLLSFAVIFHVPRRALFGALLCGVTGWVLFRSFTDPHLFVLAVFMSSFAVGSLSVILSSITRLPSQIFSVPGILALVPGMLALSSFRSFASGEQASAVDLAFHVILIGGAVVFGLFMTRMPIKKLR